jgi:DivIVA domain-containing protein
MAASLSRPDPTSPASVAEAGFNTARRGYSTDEVRAFLTSVAAEMRRLQERERQLEAELRAARAAMPGRAELDEAAVTELLGEETVRVLQTARESASQIKVRAEESASRVLREAHDEVNRLRQEAEVESARRRHDAQSEAEAEVALAKQQGREMVNEARAYRERVLADLERRTKLARQHIEELAHGRERLLQVFERARLVAVDVTGDLQAFVGPDEFVNFAPTTGPVPLMVPGAKLDAPPEQPVLAATDTIDTTDTIDATRAIDVVLDDTVDAPQVTDAVNPATDEMTDANVDEPVIDVAGSDVTVPPERDTNVVALFPGRTVTEPVELVDEALAEPAEPVKPDVGDLFARLRSEVPVGEVGVVGVVGVVGAVEAVPDADVGTDAAETDAAASTPFTRRDEAIVPLIVTAARKLKRILADEQNVVLDTLRRREPVTTVDALLPGADAHVATYLDAMAGELAAAAAAGAAEGGTRDTATLRRSLDKAGGLAAARALVQSDLVGPLRDRLARSVADGAGDNEDITRRARAVYREWKTQHIDNQLDDVFRFAFGGGVAVTAEPGTPMSWTLDPSEPACADCEDNSLAGAVASGESYPTGHTAAPAHPGCRCLTLPTHQ